MSEKVTTTEIDMKSIVRTVDPEYDEPEVVYEFSNGREFKSTDRTDSGVYEK